MKKFFMLILAMLLCFSFAACGNGNTTAESAEPTESEVVVENEEATEEVAIETTVMPEEEGENSPAVEPEETPEEIDEETQSIEVDEGLLFVDITIPSTYFENMTEEDILSNSNARGFANCVINDNGSVTYTLTKLQQKEFLDDLRASLDESIAAMVEGENAVGSFESISHSDDFTAFDVYVNDSYSEWDGLNVFTLYLAGGYYQLFDGVPQDEIDIAVNIIDHDTNEVIDSGSYQEYMSRQN